MEMPRDPWLAIDTATPPALRARELRREWERFVTDGRVGPVRAPVADSWRRSRAAGVDPLRSSVAPTAVDRGDVFDRWDVHPLREAAPVIHACLAGIANESDHLIVVSDAAGILLQLHGDAGVRSRAADSMNFTEGALWSEEGAGTNAVGTALAADHPVQIFATEHFNEVVHAWTCSAAPVHDPETGEVIGVIDLTGLEKDVHPRSLALVMTAARAVEGHLRVRLEERDNRLRARYRGRLTTGSARQALVTAGGRVLADDSRGWLGRRPLQVPPGGGELTLPWGGPAVAERVNGDDAFIVRDLGRRRPPRRSPGDELRMLADEQAALRRLATAAAHNVSPDEIFTAVAEEIKPLLGADDSAVVRFEADGTATVVAGVGEWMRARPVTCTGFELDDSMAVGHVHRTGRSARVDDAVASPIIVDGRLWGAVVVSTQRESLPADTEGRMADFTELVGTVIANAEHQAELTASRARVVAAADEARRRIQRDLHDGAQQRLVSTVLTLKMARLALGDETGAAAELLDEALAHAETANTDLRDLAHGILPGVLGTSGLRAAIGLLVSRVPLPVSYDVTDERLPTALEANAYFIVAEALTNAVKHANATEGAIAAVVDGDVLRLEVRDNGVGGARTEGSSGLIGLRDRAAALRGDLRVQSPAGRGTVVTAALPIRGALAA
jgi:signal transduction histidine kinase